MLGQDGSAADALIGVVLPHSETTFAFEEEAEIRRRFELLRNSPAGSLVRLNAELLEGISKLSPPPSFEFSIRWVSLSGRAIRLAHSLPATLQRDEGEFVLEVPSLELFACGETFSDVQEELFGQLGSLVRTYSALEDEQMTLSGVALRRRLVALGLLPVSRGSD